MEKSLLAGRFHVRKYSVGDEATVCSWIKNQDILKRVSADTGDCLTPQILARWNSLALVSLVACDSRTGAPVGFCTLSVCEHPQLPFKHIELCHLIVAPRTRHFLVGAFLCNHAESIAAKQGHDFACARVLPLNRFALKLAVQISSEEITHTFDWTKGEFRWFRVKVGAMAE